ncbi:Fc.00g104270.m01.CDS01 [Cosmosporella sp. VM-42]
MPFKTLKELDPTEGTVLLFSATARAQHVAGNDTILVPQPSDDPNDPLRWPKWRKHMAFGAVCMFACFNNISGTVLSDSFFTISVDLGVSIDKASGLISWVILILGLGNFFWVPTAIYFGKRPVFLVSCAITFAASIWAALSPDFANLQAACVVGGFGGAASEALGAAIINDLYFLHERGSKMAWYVISLAFGSSLGPLCGGYIIEHKGWAWGKWFGAILLGVNLLFIFFFAPETRFHRNTDLSQGISSTESMDTSRESKNGDVSEVEKAHSPARSTTSFPTTSGKSVKTYMQLLNPWSGINSHESYWELMLRPIPLLAYPACAFATLIYSLCLAPTVMINVLSSIILIPPPYGFSVGAVGLINVAGMIGQAIGAVLGGIVIDKWIAWRAHRNNGVFQPESRLALIFIPGLMVFLGILLFGFAVEQQMKWAVIFVAYGFVSVGLTGGASVSMTYVVDSYFPVQAECLEMINGLKNVVAFGFIHATVPWVDSDGYQKAFGALSGVFCAILALALPLLIWGPQIRHYTSSHWRLISWDLK